MVPSSPSEPGKCVPQNCATSFSCKSLRKWPLFDVDELLHTSSLQLVKRWVPIHMFNLILCSARVICWSKNIFITPDQRKKFLGCDQKRPTIREPLPCRPISSWVHYEYFGMDLDAVDGTGNFSDTKMPVIARPERGPLHCRQQRSLLGCKYPISRIILPSISIFCYSSHLEIHVFRCCSLS